MTELKDEHLETISINKGKKYEIDKMCDKSAKM